MRIEPQLSIRKIDRTATVKPVQTKRSDEILGDNKDSSTINKSAVKLQNALSQNRNNALSGLQERKEKIEEQKKEFLQRAKAQGMDSKQIAERIKRYDDEISAIEQQISQIKIDEQKKLLGTDEEEIKKMQEKQAENPNKTEEQAEKQETQNFVNLSQGMDNIKSAISLKQKLSDTANVIERQIAMDIGTGAGDSIYTDMLKEVNQKISELSVAIGESMESIEKAVSLQSKSISSENDKSTEENITFNESEKQEITAQEIASEEI